MPATFRILFASSEIAPFAKTGGLADVSGALPKAIGELGHDIRLMMPKYQAIDEGKFPLQTVPALQELEIPLAGRKRLVSIKLAFLPDTQVPVYLLDYPPFFDRPGLYGDPETGLDYPDNDERFILFCRGVLETLKALQWRPDIIHCNDWQTSLIPLYLKTLYKDDPFFTGVKTLLTIHNLAYQGVFDPPALRKAGLPESLFYPLSPVEFYGKVNFLKAGIEFADMLNTVSETYAQEIQEPEFGYGLEGVLRHRADDLYGIINGVDYSVWSPEIDPFIPYHYDVAHLEGKWKNKKVLLQEYGWKPSDDIPLIGSISRLADQKGFDLVSKAIDRMARMNLRYVLLGLGDPRYHKIFSEIQKKYPDKVSVHLKFDNRLAHLIEAGSDIFLMPSRYEPCGLNQLYSLRYGTIPVVRATGGLADTVVDFDPRTQKGTGFVFRRYSPEALLQALRKALEVYQNREIWIKLIKEAMRQDFSWAASAKKYVNLYQKLKL